MNLIRPILADAAAVTAIRRDIHAHPELCFEEQRAGRSRALTDWGIPIHRGLSKTGVVGIVKNRTSDRAVGLRADIDALPMTEHNHFAHASRHHGKMHACSHDGHTAMLLAAAKSTWRRTATSTARCTWIASPPRRAAAPPEMIRDGLFDKFPMEAIFGAHNWPGAPVGNFALQERVR